MNSSDLEYLAKFVAQRMEMGEKEWFFKPEILYTDVKICSSSNSKRASSPGDSATVQTPERQIVQKESYTAENFSNERITSQKSLQELNDTVCNCMRCSLGKSRTRFVFGSGNPEADIMFIGEAPGADEDREGLPFVGRAGKLLTKMIESIKLRREDVYIGNILKCRPPGNRDPKPEEREKCEPILINQIEIIKPKIICALGRISGQTLLCTKSSLSALRGKVHDYHGVKLIVTYHPAALLRNQNWKPHAWEDMKFIRREYDGMEL